MIFAFGPGNNSFYINNGRTSCWINIPDALATILQDEGKPSFRPDEILGLTLFPDGGWFLASRSECSHVNVPAAVTDLMTEATLTYDDIVRIDHDNSAPSRLLITTRKKATFYKDPPKGLSDAALESGMQLCTAIAIGYRGTWVYGTSAHTWGGFHNQGVKEIVLTENGLNYVVLSPYCNDDVFIQCQDGSTSSHVSLSWHRAMDVIRKLRREDNRTRKRRFSSNTYTLVSGGNGLGGVAAMVDSERWKEQMNTLLGLCFHLLPSADDGSESDESDGEGGDDQ